MGSSADGQKGVRIAKNAFRRLPDALDGLNRLPCPKSLPRARLALKKLSDREETMDPQHQDMYDRFVLGALSALVSPEVWEQAMKSADRSFATFTT